MSSIDPAQVLQLLDLRPDAAAAPPPGGMSGSVLTGAVTADDEPVIVKVTPLDSDEARGQALRELMVYTEIAPAHALPTPRLVAHHQTADWLAIALTRHDPAPPAPHWSADDWCAFARALARIHRDVPRAPASLLSTTRVDPDRDLHTFAEQLWHGPGDSERVHAVLDDLGRLRETAGSGPTTFVHGDCHTGNVLHTADGRPLLVDWQSAGTGSSAADLAFAFTRAYPTGASVPRDRAIAAYCAEAGTDVVQTDRRITAHQLLTLVREYPAFAGFLDGSEIERLRTAFDQLLRR